MRAAVARGSAAKVREAEATARAATRGAVVSLVAMRERVATAERAEAKVAHCARQQTRGEFR